MNKHLPYNVLLAIAVAAAGLMAVFNLGLRQSSFAVTVGYRLPQPYAPAAISAAAEPARQADESAQVSEIPQARLQERTPEPEIWITMPDTQSSGEDDAVSSVKFPLELNEATYQQLLFIPRVGDVTAQRIIQYREQLGGYTNLEQLLEIKGIGDKTFENITAYLYLKEEPQASGEDFEEDGETDIDEDP